MNQEPRMPSNYLTGMAMFGLLFVLVGISPVVAGVHAVVVSVCEWRARKASK
jgi:hypothetical protein